MTDPRTPFVADSDPLETHEWLDSLQAVLAAAGPERAHFLLRQLHESLQVEGIALPFLVQSPYVNTIAVERQPTYPGDLAMEKRIRRIVRWNAAVMVHRANEQFPGIGGHLSSYASAAMLYEVGFNWFFKSPTRPGGGDQVYFQGHSAPGIYARAFLEGRLTAEQLEHFRRESLPLPSGARGLSSYPHPHLMADFGNSRQFPWVWGRSRRSTRPSSTATSTPAASRTRHSRASGASSATARRTSLKPWARSRSPRAKASTT